MDNENKQKPIREQLLETIKSGKIIMKPKWHFILQAILALIGGIIILLVLLYLVSFVIFMLRQTGVWFVPIFGSHGWYEFFASLPWLLILLSFFFIVVLEILVRRYSFAYRQPLLYSAIGIILIVVFGGVIIAQTPFHRGFFRYLNENELPFASGFYRGFGLERFHNIQIGTIIAITKDGFDIENGRTETLHIIIAPQTRFPLGTDFVEGDTVVVFGAREDDTVHALGIRKVDSEFGPYMPMLNKHQPFHIR